VDRARRHQRLLSWLAFGLLALVAELAGRSLTQRVDVGRHVHADRYANADYYPFLLGAVKVGIALLLARLAWRVVRARTAERAARRLLSSSEPLPRLEIRLSPRLWAAVFSLTSLIYLVQTDAEQAQFSLAPLLHTSALPVFAVLAVLVALAWGAVQRWLADYERYAETVVARAHRLVESLAAPTAEPAVFLQEPPRLLFGLVFESRPPPAAV
jgi:hypothetical protein